MGRRLIVHAHGGATPAGGAPVSRVECRTLRGIAAKRESDGTQAL
jgi:hypothetical protein